MADQPRAEEGDVQEDVPKVRWAYIGSIDLRFVAAVNRANGCPCIHGTRESDDG